MRAQIMMERQVRVQVPLADILGLIGLCEKNYVLRDVRTFRGMQMSDELVELVLSEALPHEPRK
jgi:hypothetical protein